MSGARWFPYNKGGDFRKWYGNQEYVVNWEDDGAEIKRTVSEKYSYLNGNIAWVVKNEETYFSPSVSWSKISSSFSAFRRFPAGFIYDCTRLSAFATARQRNIMLSIMNSNVASEILRAIAPTIDFQVGDVSKTPVPDDADKAAPLFVDDLVESSAADWDTSETSWNYLGSPLIAEIRG